VSIRHLAAALPGVEMECEAEVETVRGRRIRLKVRASQAGKVIMDGHHERAVVDLRRFMTRG
jgi:predicted thioesterase